MISQLLLVIKALLSVYSYTPTRTKSGGIKAAQQQNLQRAEGAHTLLSPSRLCNTSREQERQVHSHVANGGRGGKWCRFSPLSAAFFGPDAGEA